MNLLSGYYFFFVIYFAFFLLGLFFNPPCSPELILDFSNFKCLIAWQVFAISVTPIHFEDV